ncbi:MAG: adenylate kinase [Chloroflexi bacterium]|nr:adenylate kinase [Chloroflexota bacterium]
MNIILLGAPGAGKGTQAVALVKEKGLAHVASGDLFRDNLSRGTELGNIAKTYMDKGELVPDDVTVKMVLDRIARPDCASGFLLDGFPRTIPQAEALDKALSGEGKEIGKAVSVAVPNEQLIKRLSGRWICRGCQAPFHMVDAPPKEAGKCDHCGGELYQRDDDNEPTVRNRLEVYMNQTAPLIEFYKKQGKVLEVNGNQPVADVSKEMLAALA